MYIVHCRLHVTEHSAGPHVLCMLLARYANDSPLQAIVVSVRERRALQSLSYLLSTEAEVVYGPHVGELYHLDVRVAPVLGNRRVARLHGTQRHGAAVDLVEENN